MTLPTPTTKCLLLNKKSILILLSNILFLNLSLISNLVLLSSASKNGRPIPLSRSLHPLLWKVHALRKHFASSKLLFSISKLYPFLVLISWFLSANAILLDNILYIISSSFTNSSMLLSLILKTSIQPQRTSFDIPRNKCALSLAAPISLLNLNLFKPFFIIYFIVLYFIFYIILYFIFYILYYFIFY